MRIACPVILRNPQLFSLVEKMPSHYYRVKLASGCPPLIWSYLAVPIRAPIPTPVTDRSVNGFAAKTGGRARGRHQSDEHHRCGPEIVSRATQRPPVVPDRQARRASARLHARDQSDAGRMDEGADLPLRLRTDFLAEPA